VGLNHAQASVLGIMMNTRALMELIVINVGYDLGVISKQMFTMLVLMAVFSTVITTPILRRWLPAALAGEAARAQADGVVRT
jgi:Kef-type K+ transport system membrane component KefB